MARETKGSFGAQADPAATKKLALVVFGGLLLALFFGFAIIQGIGGPRVPSGDVALVQGVPSDISHISKAKLKKAVPQQASQQGLKATPKEGTKKYEEVQEAALGELLNAIWIQGQAEELEISVTDKQIEQELEEIKKANFPTEMAFHEFLETSHLSPEEVNDKVKINLLTTKIQEQVQGEAPPVTDSEISAYYEAEKTTQFTTKPSRDIHLIFNSDEAEVEKAKQELESDSSPASWKGVAAERSSDPSTKGRGGMQTGVTEEFVKGKLKAAIFDSAVGELVGPVPYERNYLLVEVVKVKPEEAKPLGEVESQIKATLTQEKQQRYFSEFATSYASKWTLRTFCASGFAIRQCSNYKGSGHPSTAAPACYEAHPKTPATECPAPVTQAQPAMPGSVTPIRPEGIQRAQRAIPSGGGEEGEGVGALTSPTEAAGE